MKRLQDWLRAQCEQNNLSWRDASMKAGLNPGAISAIMANQQPGLKACKALANLFNISVVFILDMAGHIDIMPNSPILRHRYTPRLLAAFAALPDDAARLNFVMIMELAARRQAEKREGSTKT